MCRWTIGCDFEDQESITVLRKPAKIGDRSTNVSSCLVQDARYPARPTALAGLPAKQRAVFVLRHCEEMALEEIADSLEMNLGTVKSALHRAVRALRERLEGVRA